MRHAIVILIAAVSTAGCQDKPAEDVNSTMTRGATQAPVSVDDVRATLLEKGPAMAEAVNGLIIVSDSGIITLRGMVEDEAMHSEIVNKVRSMPNVRGVRDELRVGPKAGAAAADMSGVGTTTTTGAGEIDQKNEPAEQPDPLGGSQVGGGTGMPMTGGIHLISKSDSVRQSMERMKPMAMATVRALTITDDGWNVTVAGTVPDEATHRALLKAAKETAGVKNVKDEMKIEKKPMLKK